MKKKVLIPILALFVIGCGMPDHGMTELNKYVFVDYSISRDSSKEYSPASSGKKIDFVNYSVCFDNRICDEANNKEVALSFSRNMEQLEKLCGTPSEKLTIVFVESTIRDRIIRSNGTLFCPIKMIDTIDLNWYATMALYPQLPYWKALGINEFLFGYEPISDKTTVRYYFENDASEHFFTLFPAYFWEDFADKKEIDMAKDSAFYIASYEIDNNNVTAFLSSDYSISWEGIGSSLVFSYDEIDNMILSMTCDADYDSFHSMEDERMVFHISPQFCKGNIDNLYDFYRMYYSEIDGILSSISADAPQWYQNYINREIVTVELMGNGKTVSSVAPGNNRILVCSGEDLFHEYIHACTTDLPCSESPWVVEGVATYYTVSVQGKYKEYGDDVLRFLNSEEEIEEYKGRKLSVFDKEYLKIYREKYYDLEGKYPMSLEEYNAFSATYAGGVADWKIDSKSSKNVLVHANSFSSLNMVSQDSKYAEMTYYSSMVLCDYIIKKFGADALISVCEGHCSLEEAIGLSFEELKEEFLAQLD